MQVEDDFRHDVRDVLARRGDRRIDRGGLLASGTRLFGRRSSDVDGPLVRLCVRRLFAQGEGAGSQDYGEDELDAADAALAVLWGFERKESYFWVEVEEEKKTKVSIPPSTETIIASVRKFSCLSTMLPSSQQKNRGCQRAPEQRNQQTVPVPRRFRARDPEPRRASPPPPLMELLQASSQRQQQMLPKPKPPGELRPSHKCEDEASKKRKSERRSKKRERKASSSKRVIDLGGKRGEKNSTLRQSIKN
jgi:hypothetical protein